MPDDVRVLTHHVNVRNPKTKTVETFEPGANLPAWAVDAIGTEHEAYPVTSPKAEALVMVWQASKMAATADAVLQEG